MAFPSATLRSTLRPSPLYHLRLHCSEFYVDVRLGEFAGRGGHCGRSEPRLGGMSPLGALCAALEPFDGVIEELLGSLSDEAARIRLSQMLTA